MVRGCVYWCGVWWKHHNAVLCNIYAARVAIPHGLCFQQLVDEEVFAEMTLRRYCNVLASISFQPSGDFLVWTYVFVNV